MPTRTIHDTAGEVGADEPIVVRPEPDDVEQEPGEPEADAAAQAVVAASPSDPGFLLSALRVAGDRKRHADRQLTEAMAAVHKAIIDAHASGMTKVAIAAESGVTRQTVYDVLKKEKGSKKA
jgi:helix-turn-helix resolvase-like protein